MDIKNLVAQMTLEEKAGLCSGGDFWHSKAVERLGIPSMMMCDGPHGLRKQRGDADHMGINESIETVCYPTASALASSFDREVMAALGRALGRECQAEDVGMLLGPGVNMKRSPLCGRNFEYFSEDPYLAGELAAAYISALQGEGVSACVKHFACNSQETRRMSSSSNLTERALHETYLPAFEAAVKKGGANSVMCAYNAVNGTYCAENKELLTDILRERWGFDGAVVTDWGAVKDRVKGLLAGLDLEMPGGPGGLENDRAIVEAVRSGELDEAVLDQAAENVLKLVAGYVDARRPETAIDRGECARLSEDLAAQCAVLLKNNGVLPLADGASTAFLGEFARTPRYQGAGSSHINVPHAVGALKAAGNVPYAQGYDVHREDNAAALLAEAVELAKTVDIPVIFAGLPDSFETEGCDREAMVLPDNQNALISAVAAVNPNTVVVLHGGAPVELPWLEQVGAVLCVYLGGQNVGAAAVRLLRGEENPSGRLAESWPVKLSDNPSYLNFPGEDGQVDYHEDIFIGYRYYDKKELPVRFPFGHGLSYTSFTYSNLTLSQPSIKDTDTLTVTCKVKNTGSRAGKEVVQLYVRDETSSVRRPVRELRGFEKISLTPGEEQTVSFTLDKRAFAYYEPKIHDWFVESGTFFIELGASSRDIRLSQPVEVTGTVELPFRYSKQSTVGDLARTAKGRAVLEGMMAASAARNAEKSAQNVKNMGEGSDRMMQAMMMEMPLGSLVSFGSMTVQQLEGLIASLNGGSGT